MRQAVGILVLAAAAGCGHDRSTLTTGGPPAKWGDAQLRELNAAAAGELTRAFRDDPAAAKAKYADTRWRFPATVQLAAEAGTTASVDGVGDCLLVPRAGSGVARMQPGQQTEFAGVVDEFNPAAVGGIKLRDVDLVSRKVRDPRVKPEWESKGE